MKMPKAISFENTNTFKIKFENTDKIFKVSLNKVTKDTILKIKTT
jgi:hypothetical protein